MKGMRSGVRKNTRPRYIEYLLRLVNADRYQSKSDAQSRVVGSDPTTSFSFMPSMDFGEMVRMNYDFLPEATHMLQLEEPEHCVEITLQFLSEIGLL